jgi:hypothetical protein
MFGPPSAPIATRTPIATVSPTNERPSTHPAARRSLLTALLTTAAVALSSALGATAAQAAPHPDHLPKYQATADLDGRWTPTLESVVIADFVREKEMVPVKCQTYGGPAYGSKIWDLVQTPDGTLFVPDHFIRTGTDGRAPEIRQCTPKDHTSVAA